MPELDVNVIYTYEYENNVGIFQSPFIIIFFGYIQSI